MNAGAAIRSAPALVGGFDLKREARGVSSSQLTLAGDSHDLTRPCRRQPLHKSQLRAGCTAPCAKATFPLVSCSAHPGRNPSNASAELIGSRSRVRIPCFLQFIKT